MTGSQTLALGSSAGVGVISTGSCSPEGERTKRRDQRGAKLTAAVTVPLDPPLWDVLAAFARNFNRKSPQDWAASVIQGMALLTPLEAGATALLSAENGQTAATDWRE